MDRKSILKRLIYLIFFILLVNFLANKFYWYSSIWYFDIIMHFLGGFWVGLAVLYILRPSSISIKLILKVLSLVLVVGVGWEVFELVVNDVIAKNPFDVLDTLSDLFLDISGGLCAIIYLWIPLEIKKPKSPIKS